MYYSWPVDMNPGAAFSVMCKRYHWDGGCLCDVCEPFQAFMLPSAAPPAPGQAVAENARPLPC